MAPRLPSELRKVLLSSGMPWRIDTGTRHYKLIVGDRFAAILPKSGRLSNFSGRADKNTVAQVRRVIRKGKTL
jgi:hypothetical protein